VFVLPEHGPVIGRTPAKLQEAVYRMLTDLTSAISASKADVEAGCVMVMLGVVENLVAVAHRVISVRHSEQILEFLAAAARS
jgi:septum formation inhibitor-activating ATPase MinD